MANVMDMGSGLDNDNVYDDEWKAGVKHGQGKMTYTNGDVYVYEGMFTKILFCRKRSSAALQTTLDQPYTAKRQRT